MLKKHSRTFSFISFRKVNKFAQKIVHAAESIMILAMPKIIESVNKQAYSLVSVT